MTLVLLYHRVADVDTDPQLLVVTPHHFAQHLDVLAALGHVVPLSEIDRIERADTVAITFDDGYADNLVEAEPLLAARDMPATVFVTTGYVGRQLFWWDEVQARLLTPETLPADIELPVEGRHVVRLEPGAAVPRAEWERLREWNVTCDAAPTQRHLVYRTLLERLKLLRAAAREEALVALREQVPRAPTGGDMGRPSTGEELQAAVLRGALEFGGHTLTHPVLATLGYRAQWHEIRGSRTQLEDVLEKPVTSFAYPYGNHHDYGRIAPWLVRAAGYRRACSNFQGDSARASRFELPRVIVRDWDGDEFARQLAHWRATYT